MIVRSAGIMKSVLSDGMVWNECDNGVLSGASREELDRGKDRRIRYVVDLLLEVCKPQA